jgi:hypothetical protein
MGGDRLTGKFNGNSEPVVAPHKAGWYQRW